MEKILNLWVEKHWVSGSLPYTRFIAKLFDLNPDEIEQYFLQKPDLLLEVYKNLENN